MKWLIVLCLSVFVCLAGCRFGGAKVKADTPYGSGEIEIEEGELDLDGIVPAPAPGDPEPAAPAEDAARNEAVAPTNSGSRIVCGRCPGLVLVATCRGSRAAEGEARG